VTARRRGLVIAMVGVAIALVGAAIYLFSRAPTSTPRSTQILPTPSAAPSTSMRVVSKDLNIDLAIVEGDGWSVPYNRAAHYPGMKLPGESGRSMLYAHALAGMFGPLTRARVGQEVDILRSDQPTLRYVIKQLFTRWPPNDLTYTKPADHEVLVLLT
jgi:sortase (surface protein transpeptidase)